MSKKQRGNLFIISGPSGVGKSTVISEVMSRYDNLYFSISYTTRAPRVGEQDGVNYYFVSKDEFEQMIARDELLEYANYSGNYYGTSAKRIEEKLDQGIDVLLDIEVVGSSIVRQKRPNTPAIFVIPPSFEELSRRLNGRNSESPESVRARLNRAREEYKEIPSYDYLVVNEKVSAAADDIIAILRAESCRAANRLYLIEEESL